MKQEVYFPEGLRAIRNWCAWKLETRKGKQTKVPYSVTGKGAKSNDPDTWTGFETITELLSMTDEYNGYGFMVSDGIVFIDVDHCISDAGIMDDRGKDVLSAFPLSYAEVSQSGHGLHILTRGNLERSFNNRKKGVEMYSSGHFCAFTGRAIQALEPTEEQDGINYVFNKYCTSSGQSARYRKVYENEPSSRSDSWIIHHASAVTGQHGRNFCALFSGDTSAYESASEADSALCVLLAFWCDRNRTQIDRIFRQSGLYRPKWEREDYRNRTIDHACNHIPETLSEWAERNNREKRGTASAKRFLMYGS